MKKALFYVLSAICMIAIASVVVFTVEYYKAQKEKIEEVLDVEQEEIIPSVSDVLILKREMQYANHCDSVFLTMPDLILVNIITNFGTDLTISQIVDIYESNREVYNKVLDGVESKKLLDSLQTELKKAKELYINADSI